MTTPCPWLHYTVTIKLRDKLVGGWPKNPEVEKALLKARGLEDLIPALSIPADAEGQAKLQAEQIEKSWIGFKTNGTGPYLEARNIKAMLKEGANIIKAMLGQKNLKAKLAERVFVEPHEIPLPEVSGTDRRMVHAMTMQGPRSSMKLFDYIDRPTLEFRLKVLNDGIFTPDLLRDILDYCQENGLGADRSQGFGQFDVVSFDLDER
jgi:hypothetical protein